MTDNQQHLNLIQWPEEAAAPAAADTAVGGGGGDRTRVLGLNTFVERSYLDYSMYVLLDRALPHLADGLKPVQRRILYAMHELSLGPGAKPKKSARTIGDVLGKFHPHGESACYEAMVLMAQSFSYRYPLIDGHGNWGAADDPKSFAAMRYTEARLAPYSRLLLVELDRGAVDWNSNFDGSLDEPVTLPARLPNILLNGASGIAVGLATDIPPHNLREVARACEHLLTHAKAEVAALMQFIQGPDFPSGGEIVSPRSELVEIYSTGSGRLRVRASYVVEDGDIVVTELPWGVPGSRLVEQIADQGRRGKLIEDVRDECDHEHPVRVVIRPAGRLAPVKLMEHLFAVTDLERTVRVQLNAVDARRCPRNFNLAQLLGEWLKLRSAAVRRRLQHRLGELDRRLEIVAGLLQAHLNIDKVIEIIRRAEDPAADLANAFPLSDMQIDAILAIRLRQLAKLERVKLEQEQGDLNEERGQIDKNLSSEKCFRALLRDEFRADAKLCGDDRRTRINEQAPAVRLSESGRSLSEAVTVLLSKHGWVRSAKGHDFDPSKLPFKTGDRLLASLSGYSDQLLSVFDHHGRSYSVVASQLPPARGAGEPLSKWLDVPAGTRFIGAILGRPDSLWLCASTDGYGFVATASSLSSNKRAGRTTMRLNPAAEPLPPMAVGDAGSEVFLITSEGRALGFAVAELPQMAQGKGVKLVNLGKPKPGEPPARLSHLICVPEGHEAALVQGKRRRLLKGELRRTFTLSRGKRGKVLPKGFATFSRLTLAPPVQPWRKRVASEAVEPDRTGPESGVED